MPFWPQPGLVPRDAERGTRVERIAYFGRTATAPAWFYDKRFHSQLRRVGVEFEIRVGEWFDYRDVDLVLAHRIESPTMLRHKPASKRDEERYGRGWINQLARMSRQKIASKYFKLRVYHDWQRQSYLRIG